MHDTNVIANAVTIVQSAKIKKIVCNNVASSNVAANCASFSGDTAV